MTTRELVSAIEQPKPFLPIEQWHEGIGDALFFTLDLGEPPEVTSPLDHGFNDSYTHFMLLPDEFKSLDSYRKACADSGITTEL